MDDDLLEAIQDVEIRSGAAACVLLSGAAATVEDRRALCSFTVVENVGLWCFRGRGIHMFSPPESTNTFACRCSATSNTRRLWGVLRWASGAPRVGSWDLYCGTDMRKYDYHHYTTTIKLTTTTTTILRLLVLLLPTITISFLLLLLLLLPCTGCSPPCSFYHPPRGHWPLWV